MNKLRIAIASLILGTRLEVASFATVMEEQLRKNDQEKGSTGWKDADADVFSTRLNLRRYLREEHDELNNALDNQLTQTWHNPDGDPITTTHPKLFVRREAADLANICLMLADNYGGGLV